MLASERLIYIINRLNEHPAVTIRQLSQELTISEATVRRDLDELQKQGRLTRQHGGAVLDSVLHTLTQFTDKNVNEKSLINIEQKQKIAQIAASLIKDGDCIFIDGGSTLIFLLPHLRDKHIQIVTPNMMLMKNLKPIVGSIQFLGGTYDPYYEMVMGSDTTTDTGKFRYDLAFIGAAGIDPITKEIYTVSIETAACKQAAMHNSVKKVLLVDSSKFMQRGFCYFASSDEFDLIISDDSPESAHNIDNLRVK